MMRRAHHNCLKCEWRSLRIPRLQAKYYSNDSKNRYKQDKQNSTVILTTNIEGRPSFTEIYPLILPALSLASMVFFYIFSSLLALLTAGIILYAPLSWERQKIPLQKWTNDQNIPEQHQFWRRRSLFDKAGSASLAGWKRQSLCELRRRIIANWARSSRLWRSPSAGEQDGAVRDRGASRTIHGITGRCNKCDQGWPLAENYSWLPSGNRRASNRR